MNKKLLFLSIFLVSCTTNDTKFINCISSRSDTYFNAKYDYFSGSKTYKIELKENNSIKVEIVTYDGILKINVYDNTSSYYQGNIDQNMNFSLNLNKGKYQVELKSDKHQGSYSFSW